MNKIDYVKDEEDKIASHFANSSRQAVNLAVRTYVNDVVVHSKLVRATIKAKIIKLQEELDSLTILKG